MTPAITAVANVAGGNALDTNEKPSRFHIANTSMWVIYTYVFVGDVLGLLASIICVHGRRSTGQGLKEANSKNARKTLGDIAGSNP